MNRWLWAGLLAGALGCGGSTPTSTIASPAKLANGCPDWVHHAPDGVAWEPNTDEDEIETFTGEVAGSDLIAFKGAGPIDAPIGKVANILIDTPRHGEWVPNFGGMRVVRNISESEKVIYRHVLTPFIISDRDFVVRVRVHKEDASGHLLFDFSSVQDPAAPVEEDKVRGVLHTSGYRMWPIDGGARTMVIFTIHVDPKGDVPAWIVNLFQTGYARTNLQNIRRQAAKADVHEHPRIHKEYRDFKPKCGR